MNTLIELTKKTGRQNVISLGLDMRCNKVITKSVLVFTGERFCVENGGIKISVNEAAIDGMFLDTKENRRFLQLTK